MKGVNVPASVYCAAIAMSIAKLYDLWILLKERNGLPANSDQTGLFTNLCGQGGELRLRLIFI